MAATSDEFAALLARARLNDPDAVLRLAQQYEPRLRVVARVLLGPALRPFLDSMDLVQSVHRSLLVGLRDGRFDISSPDKLIGLAIIIVRRKAAGQWRHLQRQQRPSSGGSTFGNLPAVLAELTTPEGDPAQTAQYHDQLEQLCRQLDGAEQRMLELRLAGYSTAEIAKQLGLNHVTLRVRMTRLRERLRSSGVLDGWL